MERKEDGVEGSERGHVRHVFRCVPCGKHDKGKGIAHKWHYVTLWQVLDSTLHTHTFACLCPFAYCLAFETLCFVPPPPACVEDQFEGTRGQVLPHIPPHTPRRSSAQASQR